MKPGIFAINKEQEIVILNDELLQFAKTDSAKVRRYGNGKIENGDIVLFFGNNVRKYIPQDKLDLPQALTDSECCIALFRYEYTDCIPIIKRVHTAYAAENSESDSDSFLDTVFFEEHIRIEKDENDLLHIHVNEQEYIRSISLAKIGMLLLIRRGEIRYFSPIEDSCEQLDKIMQGEEFAAYIEGDRLEKAENFFEPTVMEALKEAEKTEETVYSNMGNRALALSKLSLSMGDDEYRLFAIGDEKAYLASAIEQTEVYNRLFTSGDVKIGRNELGCEARLRGRGKNIEEINRKLEKVCRKNVTIVLTGESGTGKTFLAKEIHKNSRRTDGPFINVNCAAIAYNLIESELFGYEDGAFTGAKKGGKVGYFELAKGGTLFLDEISELPLLLQGKLLEVLQEGTFYRVGGVKKISSDVRLIVATNRNLEKMVKNGQFREDLYYRISVFPIHLPPLRERIEDLYSIIEDTLPQICERLEIEPLMLTDAAMKKMKEYQWTGNIRELENVLEKAAVLSEGNFIREEDVILENSISGNQISKTLKEKLREYEKELIQNAFVQYSGNRRLVAESLGISKTNLFEKIHQYGIDEYPEGN